MCCKLATNSLSGILSGIYPCYDANRLVAFPLPESYAGMRVIGLTTTLTVEEMEKEAPDAVYPVIGSVSLAEILATKYIYN
jgi:hypothetical protein